jgi:hypothetical protein
MEKMSKRIYIITLLMLLMIGSWAQEGLRPMHGNPNLMFPTSHTGPQKNTALKTNTVSLSIPFFDDFSYAYRSAYPSNALWLDSSVYVNTGMARAPLSIGVATFDGLNKNGYPHFPSKTYTPSDADTADVLTSQPINLLTSGSQTLQPSDSVALIFYYQQTGNGDSPEAQDSLMVDFYHVDSSRWERQWALKGNMNPNGTDTVFKRVFIWIDTAIYLKDGFKFRFRNKAAGNGNFDNWNIDYVFLDKGRSKKGDTAFTDVTIGYVPTPLLKNYSAMPWQQYNANPNGEMGRRYSNYIRYNGTSTVNTTYERRVFDQSNTQLNFISYGALNLAPFKPGGWQHDSAHAVPYTSYTFATMTDSTDLTVKHYMQSIGGDINTANDTVYQKQEFRNYYAYDDGSCETGYYVLGTGGRWAVKYGLNIADTLRGVRISFDPVGSLSGVESTSKFRINVYTDGGAGPGVKIFTSDSAYPKYSRSGHNKYYEYKFASPLVLSAGSYYIGMQQFIPSGITIGFDKNYNSAPKLYYDTGNGWTQSAYYGSLMFRPIFGKKVDPPVGIEEHGSAQVSNIKVYPNPASDQIHIVSDSDVHYSIYSMDGKLISNGNSTSISTQALSNGIYLLEISSQDKIQHRQKIIIQH